MMLPKTLSVVIPAYNEERTIKEVVRKVAVSVHLKEILQEIIIVDDCSSDRTPEITQQLTQIYPLVKVIRHHRNQGKTQALKTGFKHIQGDIAIVQDADLEYDPNEIHLVIQPILEGEADVVYGSRFLVRRAARVLYFYHRIANFCLTLLSNCFTNLNMTDVETGYKAFRREIITNMVIVSQGFGFEIEVTAKVAKLARLGFSVYEVPISYYGRTYEEGKKIGLRDGIAAIWYIFRFNVFCRLKSSFKHKPNIIPVRSMKHFD